MANKKTKVSINALEKFCASNADDVMTRKITSPNGEEIEYEVKKRLSFEECARFVEDVVKECVLQDEAMVIPVSKDFLINKCIMVYYANFTMPQSSVKAFDLVGQSGDIIEDIVSVIDYNQFCSIMNAICDRIDFEKQLMISTQKNSVDNLLAQVAALTDKLGDMFDNISPDQMNQFIVGISQLNSMADVSTQEFANSVVNAVRASE